MNANLKSLRVLMFCVFPSQPTDIALSTSYWSEVIPDLIDDEILNETVLLVTRGREETKRRIRGILDEVKGCLDDFTMYY
jgi:hypothetical protein